MLRSFLRLAFGTLLVVFPACVHAQSACDSLYIPCYNTTSGTGFFLDLEATTDVTIEGFSTMTQGAGTRDIELYYRPGGFAGYETDATAWTLLGSASGFDPASSVTCPIPVTPVPVAFNVCIPAGERYGFYLASTAGSGSFELYDTLNTGDLFADDGTLRMYVGKGAFAFGAFTGFVTQHKILQGTIQYSCGCSTGLRDLSAADAVRLYPTLAARTVQLDLAQAAGMFHTVVILDCSGRVVARMALDGRSKFVAKDVSGLAPGVYTLQLLGPDAATQRKFVRTAE